MAFITLPLNAVKKGLKAEGGKIWWGEVLRPKVCQQSILTFLLLDRAER
jgi:hypothetical protein